MSWTYKSGASTRKLWKGRHKAEHWYRDNQVYFLTARCRGQFPAFAFEAVRRSFWDRFLHYTATYGFTWWVATLMHNHYHVEGYLKRGENLGPMMQKLHGSVAKLANDVIEQEVRTMHVTRQTRLSGSASRADLTPISRCWINVEDCSPSGATPSTRTTTTGYCATACRAAAPSSTSATRP